MDISGRRTREPSVRSISMDRLVADAHAAQEVERTKKMSDKINYQLMARQSSNSPSRRYESCGRSSGQGRKVTRTSGANVLRLDTEGREKERRKISNRENFVDMGPEAKPLEDQIYDYDSCSENNVQYLNDIDPVPTKLHKSPDRKSHRTVDTVIPTVPRLNIPNNVHDISCGSQESNDVEMGVHTAPSSSRSEKMQRTLKNISLNEREPFPGVRTRIAKQREQEKQMMSHDQQVTSNRNNNALSDDSTEVMTKAAHTEKDVVQVNSSPESVIVRPIKRKVATAPEVANKTRAPPRRSEVNHKPSATNGARSKSAEYKGSATAAKWVDKTPDKSRSASTNRSAAARKGQIEVIRPDSWRKGMAIVRRELKHKSVPHERVGSDESQPTSARTDNSGGSQPSADKYPVDKASHLPLSAQQVLQELRDSEGTAGGRGSDQSTRPKRRVVTKAVEADMVKATSKHRHYDSQSVQEFMEKKRKEKRMQELEEKKRKLQEEKARKQKLKMLQDRSRKVVSHSSIPRARDSTFTTHSAGLAAAPQPAPPMEGVWAPIVNSRSYTVGAEAPLEVTDRKSPLMDHSLTSGEGDGDTTLTEADLQAETPPKQYSSPSSKSSTPRSRRDSPLMARTKAVEEEIEQLVQAAKQRNQSARQIHAQATPLKQIDQLGSTDTTTTSTECRRTSPIIPQSVKSSRMASLAQTTAQLMTKMSMLQADLENSAMSRTHSRGASSFGAVMNSSFSPRDPGGYQAVHRPSYGYPLVQNTVQEQSETSTLITEDYNTHSSASDSNHSHSTVTSESEESDTESELSSLDLRIREALARPSNFVSAYAKPLTKSPRDMVKPVAKVSRALTYEAKGDGHSVINTYLRKLKADREALSLGVSSRSSPSTCFALPATGTSVSSMTTQTVTSMSTTGIQTDQPQTTYTAFVSTKLADSQPPTRVLAGSDTNGQVAPSPSLLDTGLPSVSSAISDPQNYIPSRAPAVSLHSTQYPLNKPAVSTQSPVVTVSSQPKHSQPPFSQSTHSQPPFSQSTHSQPSFSQSIYSQPAFSQSKSTQPNFSQSVPPPVYTSNAQAGTATQSRRISPAGLDLALSACISMLDGINQQHVQLTDVERTRFSTLAQQETVALAQILKGNKERQEQQMMSLRQKIKQDELEAEHKLAQFKREAELANQRREEAEKQGERESVKLSKEATRRVLEAQNESTKAFSEAAKLLAERRERMADTEARMSSSTQAAVDSLRVQNEAVTASLTTLVDQQRQQNMEMLRVARMEPQTLQNGDGRDRKHSPRHVTRTRSPRDLRSPRSSKKRRENSRSPRDSTRSPRDTSRLARDAMRSPTSTSEDSFKSSDDSSAVTRESTKSPRGSKSPRPRKLRSPRQDRLLHDILQRSDVSTASSRRSEETIQTASAVSYSDDFGSDKSSFVESPVHRLSPPPSRTRSTVTESLVSKVKDSAADSSIPTDIDSLPSPVKEDSIHTDSSKELLTRISTSKTGSKGSSTQGSRSTVRTEDKEELSKSRYSDSPSGSSSLSGDNRLHKMVLGAVKEVFNGDSADQVQSKQFYDSLKSVLYTLKEGGAAPIALSTPSKQSPLSSPSKPPMVAPLSPRIDRRLTMRRPAGQRSSSRSNFPVDSESDESHSLLAEQRRVPVQERKQKETASDTDQECQLSALQHQLDEAKRRHAMMKKTRQKYEFQKKQDAYKKQIEYYEDDMARMKREMEDLTAMHSSAGNAVSSAANLPIRPQIKHPRAPSSSGSDNGKQRHSSGASDADVSTPQPSVIQKPLVGKSLGQLSSGRPAYERQRSDSGRSADSEVDRQRQKTPEYGDDFESEHSVKVTKGSARLAASNQLSTETKMATAKDTPRTDTDIDYTYSNGFEDRARSSDSISESIVDSIGESLQSSKRPSEGSLSQASDLLNLDDSPSLKAANSSADVSPLKADFLEEPSLLDLQYGPAATVDTSSIPPPHFDEPHFDGLEEVKMRSRSHSDSSSHTITEAKLGSGSATPTWSQSQHSISPSFDRNASRSRSQSRSRSRSRSKSRSRSRSRSKSHSVSRSRSRSLDLSRSRSTSVSRTRSRSSSLSRSRSRSRSRRSDSSSLSRKVSPTRSKSRTRTISEASIQSEVLSFVESLKVATDDEQPLLDLEQSPVSPQLAPAKEREVVDARDDLTSPKPLAPVPSTPVFSSADVKSDVDEFIESYPSDFKSQSSATSAHDDSLSVAGEEHPMPRNVSQSSEDEVFSDQSDLVPRSPDQRVEQLEDKVDKLDTASDESVIDDLVQSGYEDSQRQGALLSLKEELEAALGSSFHSNSPREAAPDVAAEQEIPELQTSERLAESTPRLNDSDAEAREQRDFEELEKLVREDGSTDTSTESSRISFGSKSPDFLEFSTKSHEFQQKLLERSSSIKETGKSDEKSDEESELEKAISSAAAAVESFATDLQFEDANQTESQADVGLSVIEETTPRNLMSLSSSLDDLLDDGQATPTAQTPPSEDVPHSGEVTPRVVSLEASKVEADPPEKSAQEAEERQLEAAATDLVNQSLSSMIGLWKAKRAEFTAEDTPTTQSTNDIPSTVPKLSLTVSSLETAATTPTLSPGKPEPLSPTKPLSPVASPNKDKSFIPKLTSPTKELPPSFSDEDKENISTSPDKSTTSSPPSLLGTLPPLAIKTAKSSQPSAVKSPPDSHSSSSSEESVSPQRSPTKLALVEEARHEQWAQLDKEIDNVFGANDGDWFDDDFGLGPESKPASVIPTKEILKRVVIPEPVFVVPHEETEVKAIADDALDIFWQARRCGESWDSLVPTSQYLDTKDKLELEASSTSAFKQFMFELIREMLSDIYQNEEGYETPSKRRLGRGPLNRYYKHRQPPTTLDQVREIIHKHIYPAVTGKLVHPSKISRVMSVVRHKRRDKVDTILIQELREEEPSWLDYTQDEQSVKEALVEDVFKVLLDDSISAILAAYNKRYNIQPTTEL